MKFIPDERRAEFSIIATLSDQIKKLHQKLFLIDTRLTCQYTLKQGL